MHSPATSFYATTDRDGVSDDVPECLGGGEDAGDLIAVLFVLAAKAGGEGLGGRSYDTLVVIMELIANALEKTAEIPQNNNPKP